MNYIVNVALTGDAAINVLYELLDIAQVITDYAVNLFIMVTYKMRFAIRAIKQSE